MSQENLSGEWGKTIIVQERLENNSLFEEPDTESKNGYYAGRPIIGCDTPIHGGVYVGAGKREALVVDEKYGELDNVYHEFLRRRDLAVGQGKEFKVGVLTDVFDLVKEKLTYDLDATEEIARRFNVGKDGKIALDQYIHEGVGVCRHQALLVAYLLERLKREGKVEGNVSIDRNFVPGKGGHAWVRYKNSKDVIYIIDPAQNYLGKLEDIKADRENGIDRWFYARPADHR